MSRAVEAKLTNHVVKVWPLHKRVCGVRSSPFRCPALSPDEIEEYKTLFNKPFVLAGGEILTWLSLMRPVLSVAPGLSSAGLSDEARLAVTLVFATDQELAVNKENLPDSRL